jgi:hypothetical protein
MSVDDEMMVEERDSVEFERLSHPVVCDCVCVCGEGGTLEKKFAGFKIL